MYFIAAPTFCYQFEYPRSPRIRWTWLAKRVAEFAFLCLVCSYLITQHMYPTLLAAPEVLLKRDSTVTEMLAWVFSSAA